MAKDPIRGNSSEFERLEELFRRIKVRTENLESDLRSIALGTSRDFRGEAADTFSKNLTALAPALREVPDIAHQVERIFCDHKNQLVQLQRAANSAVARAETRWTEQQRADTAYDHISGDLRSVRTQLFFTPPWNDAERTRLVCRKEDLEDDEAAARARLNRANDNVEESEEELRNLAEDEEHLNKETATELKSVDVGALADPGWLDKVISAVEDVFKIVTAIAAGGAFGLLLILSTDVLKDIYNWLDDLLVVLTVVLIAVTVVAFILGVILTGGALLAALPVVVAGLTYAIAAVSAAKFAVSVALYTRGELALSDVLWDGLGVALSFAGVGGLAKFGPRVLRGLSSGQRTTLRYLGHAGDTITVAREALYGDDESIPDDWTVCTTSMPLSSDGSETVDSYMIDLPDIDIVPTMDGTLNVSEIDSVSFTADISVISVTDIGAFEAMVMDLDLSFGELSFDSLADIVYDIDLDLDFSNLEISIDSHFTFSPPEVVFADFYEAFEQELRPLLVPCELETTI